MKNQKFIATVFKEMPALKFNVNGRLFKGFMVVALNGSDYYEIYLINYQETKCVTDEAFFDQVDNIARLVPLYHSFGTVRDTLLVPLVSVVGTGTKCVI